MPLGKDEEREPEKLSDRIDGYRREIQQLVADGVEHPRYEFKRSISISNVNKAERLEFVKFVQGVANAELADERIIVLGADQKDRRFYEMQNCSEFDPATISQLLGKYLDPLPSFEAFNSLKTDDGIPFVLIVLAAEQPRPIVVKAEGQVLDKIHIRPGDIWMKTNTGLHLAGRSNLDLMYATRIEKEAEARARARFSHFREEFGLLGSSSISNSRRAPNVDLFFGSRQQLRTYVEELIADQDKQRLKMLIEIARDLLIEDRIKLNVSDFATTSDVDRYVSEFTEHFQNRLVPGIEALVEMGLVLVKMDASPEWLGLVTELLREAFETSGQLNRVTLPSSTSGTESVQFWRPALEAYIGIRCLATYVIRRNRYQFLPIVIRGYVKRLKTSYEEQPNMPFVFWPFSDYLPLPPMPDGRSAFLWSHRIQSSWSGYFGSFHSFLESASQLEFLLELNSYFAVGLPDDQARKWLQQNRPNTAFDFMPDLLRRELSIVVPIAERIHRLLNHGWEELANLAIEPEVFRVTFQRQTPEKQQLIFGGFLEHLRNWRAQALWQRQIMSFPFDWPGTLGELVKKYRDVKSASAGA